MAAATMAQRLPKRDVIGPTERHPKKHPLEAAIAIGFYARLLLRGVAKVALER